MAVFVRNTFMGKLFLTILFGAGLAYAEPNPQPATPAEKGNRLLEQGDFKGALNAYEVGWQNGKSDDCLKGIAAIYMKLQDLDGIKRYIEPITEKSVNDVVLLQIALAYSMQVKDERLFRTCLKNTKKEWLESRPALQFGIASGAKMFFAEKDVVSPGHSS